MTGSTHTLPILIEYAWSMARVCLEYGWSMPRVWLEIATPHSDHWSENAYTHRTEGLSPCATNFNIEPGQTIETPVYRDGVYVVHVAGGRYRTKLGVK
jgi:hypothetical protein